ncbi:hypothetical protein AAHI06_26040 [Pseudomonas salmasensis]|uniref:hypothetical protein n=1 Tax=Pseudomonas salmasensis TaxID=2745514 RepID=UPI00321A442A
MNTGFFPGIKSLSFAQGVASFEIVIGGASAPTFVAIDTLAAPGFTWFYGALHTQFQIRYNKSLSPGHYELDASDLTLALLCRDDRQQLYGRDERAIGKVIVFVERTGTNWVYKSSLDITFPRPEPIIQVRGTFDVSFVHE